MLIVLAEQQLYGVVNNLLLKKPFLDFRDGSTIMDLLSICSLHNNNERLWVIKLIANGLRTATDYYIYKRSHVFKHLMSLYDSSFCDDSIKVCPMVVFLVVHLNVMLYFDSSTE